MLVVCVCLGPPWNVRNGTYHHTSFVSIMSFAWWVALTAWGVPYSNAKWWILCLPFCIVLKYEEWNHAHCLQHRIHLTWECLPRCCTQIFHKVRASQLHCYICFGFVHTPFVVGIGLVHSIKGTEAINYIEHHMIFVQEDTWSFAYMEIWLQHARHLHVGFSTLAYILKHSM